jgi:hypothetical protein
VTSASTEPKVTITAVITRADGTVEDLGIVATTTTAKANPLTVLKHLLKGN